MEQTIPNWLTRDFVKEAIRNGDRRLDVIVVEMAVTRAVPKGNNYVCLVLRVEADYRHCNDADDQVKKIYMIVKEAQKGGVCDVFVELGCVDKELAMYREYLPLLKTVLDGIELTPESYFSTEDKILVLEDVSFSGYRMVERKQQFDFEHSVAALKAVAKFHAGSIKVLEENPHFKDKVGNEFYRPEVMGQVKSNNFHIAAQVMENWPETRKYANKIRDYGDKCWELLSKTLQLQEGEMHVLNHGDFWVTNILFKYLDGKPVDVKLIDLQNCRYNTPAIDLHHLFYGSIQEKVRTERYTDLLTVYLNELNASLDNCRIDQRMNIEQLEKSMKDHDFFGLFVNIFCLPFYVTDSTTMVDFGKIDAEECQGEASPLKFYYESEPYRKLLPGRLNEYEKKGWL